MFDILNRRAVHELIEVLMDSGDQALFGYTTSDSYQLFDGMPALRCTYCETFERYLWLIGSYYISMQMWRQTPEVLVGFIPRIHIKDPATEGAYLYRRW